MALSDSLGMLATGAEANPIGAVGMAAGIGLSIFGGLSQYSAAKKQYGVEQSIFGLEQQAEAQRKQMMELNAKRLSLETVRHAQRARAMATAGATSQGSQYGSGLAGGYGQIQGQAGVGLLGISQQLGAGEALFGINSQIMQQRQQYAALGSQAYTGQAISGLGGTIGQTSRLIGRDVPYF
jgi:hypothetical protein